MRRLFLYSAWLLCLAVCAACTTITITPTRYTTDTGVATTFPVVLNWYTGSQLSNQHAVARIDDRSFVLATQAASDSGLVMRFDDTLGIRWQTIYANTDERQSRTWYHNGRITVLSQYFFQPDLYGDSSIRTCIGRVFDAATGAVLHVDTLPQLPELYSRLYTYSTDTSALLMVLVEEPQEEETAGFWNSDDGTDDSNGTADSDIDYLLVPHTFYRVEADLTYRVRTATLRIPEDAPVHGAPVFAAHNGDVLYTTYSVDSTALRLSVVRLPLAGGEPDTLTVRTPRYTASDSELQPDDPHLAVAADGTVYAAWSIEDDDRGVLLLPARFDFRTHRATPLAEIPFTEENTERLFDDWWFDDPRITGLLLLEDGGLLVLFDRCYLKSSGGGVIGTVNPSGGFGGSGMTSTFSVSSVGASSKDSKAEWQGAACLNSDGSLRWIQAAPREIEHWGRGTECAYRQYGAYVHVLAADNDDDDTCIDFIFSLADGTYHVNKLPLSVTFFCDILPASTLWNNDGTAVLLFNISSDEGHLARVRLPTADTTGSR